MNIIQAILLGVVEGVTEFLPVSSTAHLIIASRFLGIAQTDFQKFFEVFIQSGAILAVVILYVGYLTKHIEVSKKVFVSFVPTAIVGLLLYRIIKAIFFESFLLIAVSLIAVGAVFLLVEMYIKKGKLKLLKKTEGITYKEAFLIGLWQALAVVPGVSRAGIVIVAMMVQGYKRDEAATYSFLLAVPTILAASVLDVYKSREILLSLRADFYLIAIGFAVSFVTAYISVKWLLSYLKRNSLAPFGIYRILLAIMVLALFVR